MSAGRDGGQHQSSSGAAQTVYAEGTPNRARSATTLVDGVVEATSSVTVARDDRGSAGDRGAAAVELEAFLREPSWEQALCRWFGWADPAQVPDRDSIAQRLSRDMAQLDRLLSDQVNAILHHPRFQKLEGSWRGLEYLVTQAEQGDNVKIRVLNVSWKELVRDLERAIEFDQSQMFRKIYSEEFDTPGGEPFAMLIGDYEIQPFPSPQSPTDDVGALTAISHAAAAAFAPFIAGAHPSMFGIDDFTVLQQPMNLAKAFDQIEYVKWNAFRQTEDSRFVGLCLPRVLMRTPYEDDPARCDGFRFREDVAGPDRGKYLWGNAAYAFGAVAMRAFSETGWLAEIRGVERDVEGGGLVPGLCVHDFATDKHGIAPKSSTEVIVTDQQEPELSELGFIPLCQCRDTERSAFYATQSVQRPKKYDRLPATMNARMSAMLQYMLCVSRFAHYLKIAARDKVGSFMEADECEQYLHEWIQQYVTADSEAPPEIKAEYPLREAQVRVRPHPAKPGSYLCVAHLWPHFQLDELNTTLRVTTELTPGQPN